MIARLRTWWTAQTGRDRAFIIGAALVAAYVLFSPKAAVSPATSATPAPTVAATRAQASPTPTATRTPAPTTTRTPAPTIWEPEIGEEARLHVDGGADQLIGLAISEAAYEQFQKALAAKDDIGVRELIILGLVFAVDNDTRVLAIEYNGGFFTPRERYRVRVLEGKQRTRAGWVHSALLVRP